MNLKELTFHEKCVLVIAIEERIEALEDHIKDSQEDLLILQIMLKKLKAT